MNELQTRHSNVCVKILEEYGYSTQGRSKDLNSVFVLDPEGKLHEFPDYIEAKKNLLTKYYKGVETESIYRTEPIKFSDGSPSLIVERWSWDFQQWNGHIHNNSKTRKEIEAAVVIVPITKKEAFELIN